MKFPKLERYNQVIWAVIGSGVVIVFAGTIVIAAVAIVMSMFDDSALPVAIIDESGTGGVEQKLAQYDFCQPVAVKGTPYQLIRVTSDKLVVREVIEERKPVMKMMKMEEYDKFGSGSGSSYYETCGYNKRGQISAVVNVLVHNTDNGAMHLALNESAVVFTLDHPKERSPNDYYPGDFPPPGVLFWEIAFTDSNSDGVIDVKDDIGAYLSDVDGRNLKRITPIMSHVIEQSYDKIRNVLTLRVIRDTNGDGKLDENDETSLIESSVATRNIQREVLDKKKLTEIMRAAEPKRQAAEETKR